MVFKVHVLDWLNVLGDKLTCSCWGTLYFLLLFFTYYLFICAESAYVFNIFLNSALAQLLPGSFLKKGWRR